MGEKEIIKVYNEGINSVIELVKGLSQNINELNQKISTLEERVNSLENQTKVKVTEHRAEVKKCSCGYINKAKFPKDINQPVQYGSKIKVASIYLNQRQFIPYDRKEEFFEDFYHHHISKVTLASIDKTCHDAWESIESNIKELLKNDEGAVHYGETGIFNFRYPFLLYLKIVYFKVFLNN